MLEIFNEAELLDESKYDVALYDVLGDVVCGGFAAPLRRGIGNKVVIVTSEELMAMYAANNIARAVVHYADNGIALAGLVVNIKDPEADRSVLERFAAQLNTTILAWIPRDPLIREAEFKRTTVVEMAPEAPISKILRKVAEDIIALDVSNAPLPTPFDEQSFYEAARTRFRDDTCADSASDQPPPIVEDAADTEAPRVSDVAATSAARARRQAEAERYRKELQAGARAVSLGLVGAGEAVRRLREAFPERAAELCERELLT